MCITVRVSPSLMLKGWCIEGCGVYTVGIHDNTILSGDEVTPFYDPLIAKLVVWAEDRPTALKKLRNCLLGYQVLCSFSYTEMHTLILISTSSSSGGSVVMQFTHLLPSIMKEGYTPLIGFHFFSQIAGVNTNINFLERLASHESFKSADVHTGFIPVWCTPV